MLLQINTVTVIDQLMNILDTNTCSVHNFKFQMALDTLFPEASLHTYTLFHAYISDLCLCDNEK